MTRRLVQLCLTVMLACGWPLAASAEDTLIWLLRDLPPLTIFEGPHKGQGALDQLLPRLIERLPEYRHQVLREIPQEAVQQSYASWLDPIMRAHYLRDNPSFFQDSPEP